MFYNKVVQMGNLTRDPDLTYTPSGTEVVTFGLAVNQKYKDKESTCFIDVVIYGKLGGPVMKYKHKGDKILVEGRLEQDRWEDKESGAKRSKHKIVATAPPVFVDSRGQASGGGKGDDYGEFGGPDERF